MAEVVNPLTSDDQCTLRLQLDRFPRRNGKRDDSNASVSKEFVEGRERVKRMFSPSCS